MVKVGESPQIQRLLESAAKSKSLEYLDLSNNDINADGEMALALARLITDSNNLIGLDLRRNQFTYALPVFEAFACTRTIQSIQLSGCRIDPNHDPFALRQIGKSLASNPILKSLDLSENPLTDHGIEALVQLAAGCQLQKVNLENCDISDKGFDLLGPWLQSMASLSSLNIAHNARASAQSLAVFVSKLIPLLALAEVDLTGNNNDISAPYLQLLEKGNIQVGRFSHASKDLSSPTNLDNSMTFPATLTQLDLSNHVFPLQRDDLMADLGRHPNLTTLNLFGCQLSSGDVSAILASINLVRVNLGGPFVSWDNLPPKLTIPSIQALDLTQACLLSPGVQALAVAISDSYCHLEQICLDGCRLGDDDSVRRLLEAMTSVQVLVLSNCALTNVNYYDLIGVARQYTKLQVIDLAGNRADCDSMTAIAQLIQSNPEHLCRIRIPGLSRADHPEISNFDIDRVVDDFFTIFASAIRNNEFLCELDASELKINRLSCSQKTHLADALEAQGNSRLFRLTFGNDKCNIGENNLEEEDRLDNRIAANLAFNSLRSTAELHDWSRLGRV